MATPVLVGRRYGAVAGADVVRETLPGVSFRCLAYAVPLSLLAWTLIFCSIAVAAGYVKL